MGDPGAGENLIDVDVLGVRVEVPSNQPLILLREAGGSRFLTIWIGAVEATAIAFAQQGVVPPRPLTHDLFVDVLRATNAGLREVRIVDVRDGVYFATLEFDDGVSVSARPSDAVALALRLEIPVKARESVLRDAGVHVPSESDDDLAVGEQSATDPGSIDAAAEVERFREFLDHVSPEDFFTD